MRGFTDGSYGTCAVPEPILGDSNGLRHHFQSLWALTPKLMVPRRARSLSLSEKQYHVPRRAGKKLSIFFANSGYRITWDQPALDREARRLGVTHQALVKLSIAQQLEKAT